MKTLHVVVAVMIAVMSTYVIAHSGGTDKSGCHKDRSTGTRHCH